LSYLVSALLDFRILYFEVLYFRARSRIPLRPETRYLFAYDRHQTFP
jgi:hypothetical protein